MTALSFVVPGRPVTWQRTNTVRGRRVTAATQRAEKRRIALIARAALPHAWSTDAAYAIEVVGYWPDRRFGDVDRLVSLTMDALEGVAYLRDRQVRAQASAMHVDRSNPRVEVLLVPYDAAEVTPEITITLARNSTSRMADPAWEVAL